MLLGVITPAFTNEQTTETYAEQHSEDEAGELSYESLEALERIRLERQNVGLFGFDGIHTLADDDTPTNVIVLFHDSPAGVQVAEAVLMGENVSIESAEHIVETGHALFARELSQLFNNGMNLSRMSPYTINAEFRLSLNGVAMTLPANMVLYVAAFESVRVIYPDYYVDMPEPVELSDDRNPFGMSQGRARMGADVLYDDGIDGTGILVAILDTGIDWEHPAFTGSFISIADMNVRRAAAGQPLLTNADGININGVYYYVGYDAVRHWPGNSWRGNPAHGGGNWGNDPMETSPMHHPGVGISGWSSHGTHVAGTIVGRDIITHNEMRSIRGVAPGALAIHYRVLMGSTPVSVVSMGIERIMIDRPDVVNMSLGGGRDNPVDLNAIAINNIMIANPNITFVIAAGNAGNTFGIGPNPTHPGTIANPGNASLAISVSSLEEPTFTGLSFVGGGVTTSMQMLADHSSTAFTVLANNRIIDLNPRLAHNNGEIRVFAMPDISQHIGATGTGGIGVGVGLSQDFAALMADHAAEDLAGAYVVVRRMTDAAGAATSPFATAVIEALNFGFAGVILVDGTGEGAGYINFSGTFVNITPGFLIDNADGRVLVEYLLNNGGKGTFHLASSGAMTPLRVSRTSSYGPLSHTFEIKPDIGAHGVNVFSTVPRWTAAHAMGAAGNWQSTPWDMAYQPSSGTSMAAPHVAGAVALMLQYSMREDVNNRWTSEEIRARIMNTAQTISYDGSRYTPFDGARQINVLAAVKADTVVYVTFDRVSTIPHASFPSQPSVSMRTGSFSFGGATRNETATMTARIEGTPGQTFYISHLRITQSPRPHANAFHGHNMMADGDVIYPASVTIGLNGYVDFEVTVHMPDRNIYRENMAGYIIVENASSDPVARLPFAAVGMSRAAVEIMLYRNVISRDSSPNRHMPESRTFGMFFTAFGGFRYTPQFWTVNEFGEADQLIHTMPRVHVYRANLTRVGMENWAIGGQFRGQIGVAVGDGHLPPGSYILRLVIEEEISGFEIFDPHSIYYVDFPVFVDDTPPEISDIAAHPHPDNNTDVIITGHVYDELMNELIAAGNTFDIWRGEYSEMSLENNLAVWVLVGYNSATNRPVRATVNADGTFSAVIPNARALLPAMITVWALDNYSVVPQVDRILGPHQGGVITPPVVDRVGNTTEWFTPTSYVLADPSLVAGNHLQTGRLMSHYWMTQGQQQRANNYVWIGTNITYIQHQLGVELELAPMPVINISGIPTQIRQDLLPQNLSHFANIMPEATGRSNIIWTIVSGNATITPDGVINASELGQVVVQATIPDGQYVGLAFVQSFTINIVDRNAPLLDVSLYRSVFSTGTSAAQGPGRDIGIFYQANRGFVVRPHIIRVVDGLTADNWRDPQFAYAYVGFGNLRAGNASTTAGNRPFNAPLRGMAVGLFNNSFFNPDGTGFTGVDGQPHGYLPDGEHLLILEMFEENNANANLAAAWAGDVGLQFFVDNTPPTIEWLRVDGQYVNTLGGMDISVHPGDAGVDGRQILVEGRITDEFTSWAAANNINNYAWRETSPNRQMSFSNNIAVWVLAGANTAANRPVRVDVDENGYFSYLLPVMGATANLPTDLNIWVYDGWTIQPIRDGWFGNSINAAGVVGTGGGGDWSHGNQNWFSPTTNLQAGADINGNAFRHARMWGYAANANLNNAIWVGTNMTSFNARLVPPPTLSVEIDSVRVTPDGIAIVEINLSNNPGLHSMQFTVNYDNILQLIDFFVDEDGDGINEPEIGVLSLQGDVVFGDGSLTFTLVYNPDDGSGFAEDTHENGRLVTLIFRAADSVEYLSIADITIDVHNIFSVAQGNLPAYNVVDNSIEVAPAGANIINLRVHGTPAVGGPNHTWFVDLYYGYILAEITAADIDLEVVEGLIYTINVYDLAGGIWHIMVGEVLNVLTITVALPSVDAEIVAITVHGEDAAREPGLYNWNVLTALHINHERTRPQNIIITLSYYNASYVIEVLNNTNTLWQITVTAQDGITTTVHTVTLLPMDRPTVITEAFLTRPVVRPHNSGIGWATQAHPPEGSAVGLFFTTEAFFSYNVFLYRDGVRVGAMVGGNGPAQRHNAGLHGTILGQRHQHIMFQQWGFAGWNTFVPGDYEIRMQIFNPSGGGAHSWVNLPLNIDHDAPVISDVAIGGNDRAAVAAADGFIVSFESNEIETITITGNVFDEFMFDAVSRGLTFGMWNNPADALVTIEENLAVWVLAGENVEGNRPVRATVSANGDFTVDIEINPADLPLILNIWAVDNWAPHPIADRVMGGTSLSLASTGFLGIQDRTNNTNDFFTPGGYLRVAEEYRSRLNFGLRQDGAANQASSTETRDHVWSGIHTTHVQFTLYGEQLFDIIAVTDITGVIDTMRERTDVNVINTAQVHPANATNRNIAWTLVDDNNGNATFENGVLRSQITGSATIRATIADATIYNGEIVDYVQDFVIEFTLTPPPVHSISLARSVLSVANAQGGFPQHRLTQTLRIYYTPDRAFIIVPHIYRAVDGLTEANWREDWRGNQNAFVATSQFNAGGHPNSANNTFGQNTLGQLWFLNESLDINGNVIPVAEILETFTTGDYFLVLEIFEFGDGTFSESNLEANWFTDTLIPFSIDNEPPVIDWLRINGENIDVSGGFDIAVTPYNGDSIVITGQVSDVWTQQAAVRGLTNGSAWLVPNSSVMGNPLAANPHQWGGGAVSMRNNIAVWVSVGPNNNDNNRPQRAYVNEDGTFSVELRGINATQLAQFPANLNIFVFDGWGFTPVRYGRVGNALINNNSAVGTGVGSDLRASQQFFRTDTGGANTHFAYTVRAHGSVIEEYYNRARIWGQTATVGDIHQAAFVGNNLTRFSARMVVPPTIEVNASGVYRAEAGDALNINVVINNNTTGFNEAVFELRYDTRLVLDVGSIASGILGDVAFTRPEAGVIRFEADNDGVDFMGNGTIVSLTFNIPEVLSEYGNADFIIHGARLFNVRQDGYLSGINVSNCTVLITPKEGIVPVDNITGLPETQIIQEMPINLNNLATINPVNATNTEIMWSITGFVPEFTEDGTLPTIEDGILSAISTGVVTVRATIINGAYNADWDIIDFVQDFEIEIIRRSLPLHSVELLQSVFSMSDTILNNGNRATSQTPNVLITYIPTRGLRMRASIVRAEDGMDERNWYTFENAFIASMNRAVGLNPDATPGVNQTMNVLSRGMVLNFSSGYLRDADDQPFNPFNNPLFPDGEYFIVLEVFEWGNGSANINDAEQAFTGTILLPISINSAPPVIEWLRVNGAEVDVAGSGFDIVARPATGAENLIIIEGKIFDAWTEAAQTRGLTNARSVWREANTSVIGNPDAANPHQWGGYEINYRNSVAVWISVGPVGGNNRPQRAMLQPDGTFSMEIRGEHATFLQQFPANIEIVVLNGWTLYPHRYFWVGNNFNATNNSFPGGAMNPVGGWDRQSQAFFELGGGNINRHTVQAQGGLHQYINQSRMWNIPGTAVRGNEWFFHGNNVTIFNARLVTPPTITVAVPQDNTVAISETIDININIGGNWGVSRITAYMHFDPSRLVFDSTGPSGLLAFYSNPEVVAPGVLRLELYNPGIADMTTASGTLATLTFSVNPTAVTGTTNLTLDVGLIFSAAQGGNLSAFNVANGTVNVVGINSAELELAKLTDLLTAEITIPLDDDRAEAAAVLAIEAAANALISDGYTAIFTLVSYYNGILVGRFTVTHNNEPNNTATHASDISMTITSSFGVVPPTGIQDIMGYFILFIGFIAISSTLWVRVIRRR